MNRRESVDARAGNGGHFRDEEFNRESPFFGRQSRQVDQPVPVVAKVVKRLDTVKPHVARLAEVHEILVLADLELFDLGRGIMFCPARSPGPPP